MDDTTIITDADYGVGTVGVFTGVGGATQTGAVSVVSQSGQVMSAGTVAAIFGGAVRTWTNKHGDVCSEYIPPEEIYAAPPPAKPKKPPPALPVEVWQDGAFDADRAWQATIAACKGVR